MKREISILALVLLISFTIIILRLYPSEPHITVYSNVTELYSLFAPYMEEKVNYKLGLIDCNPTEYYYEDEAICFICKKMDACFEYGWVNTGAEKKTNLLDSHLKSKRFNVKVANFYADGLASGFNCRKEGKGLACDLQLSFIFEDEEVKIMLENPKLFNQVAERICLELENTGGGVSEKYVNAWECGDLLVGLVNGEISYVWL